MKSLFLSHCHADKKFVRKLAKDLHDRNVYIWIDEAEIKLGDSLLQKISDGINRVDYVGVVLSQASVRSKWVQKEVEIAMNQEIEGRRLKVLPILIEDCEMPPFIAGKLYADFRKGYSRGLATVLTRLDTREFFGPHQPIVRSHEISVSTQVFDQVPQIVRNADDLLIQWVEHKSGEDIVYIYVLDTKRFQFRDCFFYSIPGRIYSHWLLISDLTVASIVQLEDSKELWYTDATNPSQLNPVKSVRTSILLDSIIATNQGFLAAGSFGEQLELLHLTTRGSAKKIFTRRLSGWTAFTSLVPLPKGIGIFMLTIKGIEYSLINRASEIQPPKTVIAADSSIDTVANLDVRFYDNCTWAAGKELFLLCHRKSQENQRINLCTVSTTGKLISETTIISNTDKVVHIFKPSLAVGQNSVLVLWNVTPRVKVPARAHQKTLLSCMLFDRTTCKPLLPYERTLTAGANFVTGIPAIVTRNTYYIAYQEDLLERFNIKVSELALTEVMKTI
jgi:hypothetical protein